MAFDREKTLQAAQKYVDKRKYDRAILEYQKVVQHEPNDARTLLRIGDLQARLGSYPEAIATYDRVALYYSGRGFHPKAVAVLKQISELIERHAPQLADQYSHVAPKLAQTYAELGLVNDALATYDAIARRLQERGRDRDAVEIIRRMVALERSNPLPYLRLAEALCRVTRVDEATEHFWSAAQLLQQQGRSDDAIKVLERILHFRHDVRVARVAAQLYLAKGTRDAGLSALSRLQLCFDADPRDLDTLALLARAFDVIGQPAKGVEVYKEMVRIAFETGQDELRSRYLQHLVAVAPNDPDVRKLVLQHGGGAPSQRPPAVARSSAPPESIAEDDLEFIDAESVPPPPSVPARGSAARRPEPARGPSQHAEAARRPAEASVPGARAARSRESQPPAEFLRKALLDAESFRGLKLYSKATATLRHALTVAPASIELRAALQQVLLETGDSAQAIEQMLAVAHIYIERGSYSAAEAELHQIFELDPESPAALQLQRRIEALTQQGRQRRREDSELEANDDDALPSQTEHEAFELRARVSGPPAQPAHPVPGRAAKGREEPLPAYELEDDDLLEETPAQPVPAPAVVRKAAAVGAQPTPDAGPLPRFRMDSSSSEESEAGVREPAAAAAERAAARRAEPARTTARPAFPRPADVVGPAARTEQRRADPMRTAAVAAQGPAAPQAPVAAQAAAAQPLPSRTEDSVAYVRSDAPSLAPVSSGRPPASRESVRAALDEAEFFSGRGLYQDAVMILRDRLEQYPGDPDLIEAIARIEPKLSTESGTRDVAQLEQDDLSADDELVPGKARPAAPPPADTAAAGAHELRVQFGTDGALQAGPIIDADAELEIVNSLDQPRQQQVDVDEVFAKFKQGVKAQVSDNDSATHYDLGVAYKEMGLFEDAAREFEIAARDPKRECNALAMMGLTYRESGDLDRAAEAYVRGLNAQQKTVAQEVSLYYDLGVIYEQKNDADEAIYYFQRITRRDPTYRDVAHRLKVLLPRSRRFSQPARAINDDQDFERSFEELYKPD